MTSPSSGGSATASASVSSRGLARWRANIPAMSSRIRRPPLPCARRMRVSFMDLLSVEKFDDLAEAQAGVVDGDASRQMRREARGFKAVDDGLGEQAVLEHAAGEADRADAGLFAQLAGLVDQRLRQAQVEAGRALGWRAGGIGEQRQERGPVAAPDPAGIARQRKRNGFAVG